MPTPCAIEPIRGRSSESDSRYSDGHSSAEFEALRQLVERTGMAFAVYDVAGCCLYSTAAMAKAVGVDPNVWRETSLWDVEDWKTAGILRDAVLTLADGDSRTRAFATRDKKRIASVTVHRLRQSPGDLVALVIAPSAADSHEEHLVDFATATANRVNAGLVPATCALELLAAETSDSRVSSMLILQAQDAIRRVTSSVTEVVDDITRRPSADPLCFLDIIESIRSSQPWHARARLFIDMQAIKQLPKVDGSAERIRGPLERAVEAALGSSETASVAVDATCVDIEVPIFVSSGRRLEPGTYVVFSITDDPSIDEDDVDGQLGLFSALQREQGRLPLQENGRDHGGGVDVEFHSAGMTTVRIWIAVDEGGQ